ncbi:MAG: hypothetical protein H0X02_12940 [Nitrosomonas sp.]|nr:hypothetical protein [Nitrosomonas sp.]
MMKIGYFNEQRLHINDYKPDIHEGKVYCADKHVLIPKRGEVRTHHFSHRAGEGNADCSGPPKGSWHYFWQLRLLPTAIESRFTKPVQLKPNGPVENVLKIADSINVIGQNKDILSIGEFQHSVMSKDEFVLREAFYTRTDLLSHCGLPYCKSELTWIFDLTSSDIEIDEIFGDIVCFRLLKGTKYMLEAKARAFYDFAKRDLIMFIDSHKVKTQEPRMIGRLIPLKAIDEYFFKGVLAEPLTVDQQRLNCLPLADYKSSSISIADTLTDKRMSSLLTLIKDYYFVHYKKTKAKGILKDIESLVVTIP